jgi:hypothetical protein
LRPLRTLASFALEEGLFVRRAVSSSRMELGVLIELDCMMRRAIIIGVVVLWACAARPHPSRTAALQCPLTAPDTRWIQGVLDGWTRTSRDFLGIDPDPLPRIVLFNSSCAWHLGTEGEGPPGSVRLDTPLRFARQPVAVHALSHDGTVMLPTGARIPAEIIAVAMPAPAGQDGFLVLALPELWRRHSQASKDPHLDIRIPSVALHEMIHTRQMPDLQRRVRAIGKRFDLPGRFDDDVVEDRFGDSVEYRRMFIAERDLLYDAVAETDRNRSIALVGEAISVAQTRRERFFVGNDGVYSELEGLFLNMEGVAEWVRFKSHQADPAWPNADADIIAFLCGQENSWSQDEGLALLLLLDRFVPDWKRQILSPSMPSPWAILREAIPEAGE